MKVCNFDFETRSAVNITTRGGGVYMEHDTTDALLASYTFDGETIRRWRRPQPMPDDLREHVEAGGIIQAFNASFERGIWRIMARKHGWAMPHDEQFRCSKATAAALGLPRNLDGLAKALSLPVQKDERGKELIKKFSIPRARNGDVFLFNEPEDFPDDYELFHDYCDRDVLVEAAASVKMVPLSTQEQTYWLLDQRINERGVRFDFRSLEAAIGLAEAVRAQLDRKMSATTEGAVGSCDEIAGLLAWLATQGVVLPSLGKDELLRALRRPDLPAPARKALEIREQAAKSSTRKLVAIKRRLSRDGRLRGVFVYHGTHPGRWTSAGGVNLANLPRSREAFSELRKDVLFKAIRTASPSLLPLLYGPEVGKPLHLLADAVRSFIWAAPGHDLIACDYAAIQGRVAAWLAGETWKIRAYEEIDRDPTAPDLYRRAASAMTGIPLDVLTKKHPLRQIGKTAELACFGKETYVLTSNGAKLICDVQLTDKLWDGVEWISHCGVIERNARPVVVVDGIAVTADHLILTGQTWKPAGELLRHEKMLRRALATGSANLPSSAMTSDRPAESLTSRSDAHAASNTSRRSALSDGVKRRAVAPARIGVDGIIARKDIWPTTTLCRTKRIGDACLIESLRAINAAITKNARLIETTARAVLRRIGVTTGELSCRTLSRLKDGTTRLKRLIESTLTATMRPATLDSYRERNRPPTRDELAICSHESPSLKKRTPDLGKQPVYDILNAGPRNRFTVCSASGYLIAHNCQFQSGVVGFYAMAVNYNLTLEEYFEHVWSVSSPENQERAVRSRERALKMKDTRKADVLSREAWLTAELSKLSWRDANSAMTAAWAQLESTARLALLYPGREFAVCGERVTYLAKHGYLWCRLPSTRCIAYAHPKLVEQVMIRYVEDGRPLDIIDRVDRPTAERMVARGEAVIEPSDKEVEPRVSVVSVDAETGRFQRYGLYGGLQLENLCLGIERDILAAGMVKLESAGYRIVSHVYDEAIAEVPHDFGSPEDMASIMSDTPEWASGLPVSADGWRGKRYRKA